MLPRSPDKAISEYQIWVYGLLDTWHTELLRELRSAAIQDGWRNDAAIWGKVKTILALFSLKVSQVFSPQRLTSAFTGFAQQVIRTNLSKKIPGVDPTFGGSSFIVQSDKFLQDNIRLITSIPEQELGEVEAIFASAESAGLTVADIADQIASRFSVSQSRARLIANDQTLKLNAAITRERQRQAGIIKYVWTTSHDELVRGDPFGKYPEPRGGGGNHFRLDGTVQLWNAPPIVNTRTLVRAHPGEDYQCRCGALPVFESQFYL